MRDVSGGLVGVLGISRDISARRRAEEALRESEERWRSYVENAPYSIFVAGEKGRFIRANPETCRITGYGEEELLSRSLSDLLDPESRVVAERSFAELLRTGRAFSELGYVTKAGEKRWWALAAVRFSEGRFLGYAGDITERRRGEEEREKLQAQLLQAQKMESVGRLAGGVAHDFNNMLGVIIGHAEMALEEEGETGRPHLQEIHKAALRSADLTRQLLAFARKQTVAPQILNLNDTVTNMLKILRRLIGEDIDLVWAPGVALWPVRVDPSQIDQILANLCVNARDAVAGVGKVLIETENVTLDETYCADRADFVPGDYVMLAVSDDGCGMDREMLSRIFEPFFTTKEMGQGTGLGLATVYGVVRQNEGYVNAYSEPGQGSTFRIYLPRHGDVLPPSPHKPVPARPGRGGETLLLVEDEPAILDVARIMLERLGYRVLTAGSPGEAIRLAREEPGRIHLLVTDVVMPEMNGRDLADRLRPLNHDMKILFMSGYTANVVAHRGVLDGGVSFLQKPFSVSALAAKVRDVLDGE
jgi:PAS domain S-box-containing protein